MYGRNTTCASCAHFPRAGIESPEPTVCEGLEQARRHDFPACPLHNEPRQRAERDARRKLVELVRKP